MKKLKKLLIVLVSIAGIFFAVTGAIYYFNLDMKAAARLQPLMDLLYDRRKRTPMP